MNQRVVQIAAELYQIKNLYPEEWLSIKQTLINDLQNDMIRIEEFLINAAFEKIVQDIQFPEE